MSCLNLDLDYFDHPKTKRLIGLLGRGAEVLPIRLWSYCGKFHCEDGRLTGYADEEIESLAGWWGKTGEMLPAMQRVGFVERDEVGWYIHEWSEHQGHIVAYKIKGKMMAESRWSKVKNATSITTSSAASIPDSNAVGPPQQCHNLPNLPNKEELPEEVVFWNSKPELPQVKSVSSSRMAHLRARRKDAFFVKNYQEAISSIPKSRFLMGQNERKWKADFDWLLQPDSVAKIMEGKYGPRDGIPVGNGLDKINIYDSLQ